MKPAFEIMQFIAPDLLGDMNEIQREWCSGKLVKDPAALGTYMRDKGFFLRRTEHDETVKAQIPPLNTVDWEVEWSEDAAAAVDDLTRTLAQKVLEGRFVERGQAARELDMMMRMKTGITDPTLGMKARQQDDSRMRKLAMEVLGMTNDPDEPDATE